jgi:hypothetical protein
VGSQQDPPAGSGPPEDETGAPGDDRGPAAFHPDPGATDRTPQPSAPVPSPAPEPAGEPTEYPSGGSVRYQDAATTRPRPLTVGEARARDKAIRKQQEIEEARLAAEAKRQKRNRRLMGGAAAVGVVGVVAGFGYWALSPSHVTAQCVRDDPNGQPVIVPDSYCSGHTAGLNGFFFYAGHQYRYYYGSSGTVGSRPVGGTTVEPKGATITTKSGTTIQRGGLGSKFGGSKSGGS